MENEKHIEFYEKQLNCTHQRSKLIVKTIKMYLSKQIKRLKKSRGKIQKRISKKYNSIQSHLRFLIENKLFETKIGNEYTINIDVYNKIKDTYYIVNINELQNIIEILNRDYKYKYYFNC